MCVCLKKITQVSHQKHTLCHCHVVGKPNSQLLASLSIEYGKLQIVPSIHHHRVMKRTPVLIENPIKKKPCNSSDKFPCFSNAPRAPSLACWAWRSTAWARPKVQRSPVVISRWRMADVYLQKSNLKPSKLRILPRKLGVDGDFVLTISASHLGDLGINFGAWSMTRADSSIKTIVSHGLTMQKCGLFKPFAHIHCTPIWGTQKND